MGLRACNIPAGEGGGLKTDSVSTALVQPPGGPRPTQVASDKKASEGRGAEGPMASASRNHGVGRRPPVLIGTGEVGNLRLRFPRGVRGEWVCPLPPASLQLKRSSG